MKRANAYRLVLLATLVLINELVFLLCYFMLVYWAPDSLQDFLYQRPELHWALLGSILLALLWWWNMRRKSKALSSYAHSTVITRMMPSVSPLMHFLHFALWRWAIAALIIAAMNPRYGIDKQEAKAKGIDIMICFDVSKSMDAEDLKPSRMESAKQAITNLFSSLDGDRIGLIPFAGDAYVQMPLTNDYGAAGVFLNGLDTDIIPSQGTDIGKAIDLATERLEEQAIGEALILVLSDGEDHIGEQDGAIEAALEAGFQVHTVGLGTEKGARIPLLDYYGHRSYKKDEAGEEVITKFVPKVMQDIAAKGGGRYYAPKNGAVDLGALVNNIRQLEQSEMGITTYENYRDYFQIFLLIGCVLVIIESMLPHRKRSKHDI